jgi:hypothetical protein
MRRLLIPALLAVLPPSRAAAQRSDVAGAERLTPAYAISYGTPLRFSVAAGAALDLDKRQTQGILALVEQGQHGTELSAGYFMDIGRFGSGLSVRGAVLRTDGEPWKADPNTTYAGAELHLQVLLGVGGRLGLLRRVSRNGGGSHDGILTVGLSIGS